MRRSNVALRLQTSILDEARRVSEAEGVALNQFINVAVAEKIAALRTLDYLKQRALSGSAKDALAILDAAGTVGPVEAGDEVVKR